MDWLLLIFVLNIGILVYTYVLFPTWMALAARDDASDVPVSFAQDEWPSVSIVIPAHNEQAVIAEKLYNALAIDYPSFEIIVGADDCRDATHKIVESFGSPRVRLLAFAKRRGKTSVINDAVGHANGQVFCFCDANVFFRPDAVRRMVRRLLADDVGAVSGDVQLQSKQSSFGLAESLYYWIERRIHRGESRFGAMMGVDGGMYVIKRECFVPLRPDTILDDFTISMNVLKSGKKVVYEARAIATESATESATSEFKRRVRISAGVTQVLARGHFPRVTQPLQLFLFVSHKLLRWLSSVLLFGGGVLLAYLAIFYPACRVLLGLAFGMLAFAAAGAISTRLRQRWLFSVPFYFVLGQVAMACGLTKGMLFSQEAIWEPTERQPHTLRGSVQSDVE